MLVPRPETVLRIELDRETYDPIRGAHSFTSRAKAARSVDKTLVHITQIINQNAGNYCVEFYGQLFTFVNASSTQQEIDEHIEKIKQHFSVVVVYLDSNCSPTEKIETFKDEIEAEKYTGVNYEMISAIKKQNSGRYTAIDRNGDIVTFFSGDKTKEERMKFIE